MAAQNNYFDYAASCPPFPEALDEFVRISSAWIGNPSSTHGAGRLARSCLEGVRERICRQVGFSTGRLLLTSGGSESNNAVIRGVMAAHPGGRLLLAADVHASAWFACGQSGYDVDVLPVQSDGRIDPEEVARRLRPDTHLCSVLHGNNETGVVHDIAAIGKACADRGVLFHCDGVQAVGHLALALDSMPFDFYTFSAHKFGAPRGAGGIFLRDESLTPMIVGGHQERGLRAGTENVAGLAGTAVALQCSLDILDSETERLRSLAREAWSRLQERIPGCLLNSDLAHGLPGLLSVSFPGVLGTQLVSDVDLQGFAISAGSACHAHRMEPSRIIEAMGRTKEQALGTVRISMGRHTEKAAAMGLCAALEAAVKRARLVA